MGEVEHELITDGLEKSAVRASFLVRTLNINFKFKFLLLLGALITFQNEKKTCIISMIIIQSLYMIQVVYCLIKHKKVYESGLHFLSMLSIELSIFLLLLICCIFYIWENIVDYKSYFETSRSSLEEGFIYVLVGCICLSMLVELAKVLIELCIFFGDKFRKKSSVEKK